MRPVEHELKTWPEFYEEVEQNRKLFEIRRDDRNFKVGDVLWLREYTLGVGLSGRETRRRITYVTDWKQAGGYVVLGIEVGLPAAGRVTDAGPAGDVPRAAEPDRPLALNSSNDWWHFPGGQPA